MDRIITTVTMSEPEVFCDMEMPVDLPIEKLLDDIIQALIGQNMISFLRLDEAELFSPRLNRVLNRGNDLADEGVWNGDYLELRKTAPQLQWKPNSRRSNDVLHLDDLYGSEW